MTGKEWLQRQGAKCTAQRLGDAQLGKQGSGEPGGVWSIRRGGESQFLQELGARLRHSVLSSPACGGRAQGLAEVSATNQVPV